MTTVFVRGVEGQRCLEVELQSLTSASSVKITLPNSLSDLAQLEEIRWFVEDHARLDPFALRRAEAARLSLKSYGSTLANAICSPGCISEIIADTNVMILLTDDEKCSLEISRIHWEILENLDYWTTFRPCTVSVVRAADQLGPAMKISTAPTSIQNPMRQQHILAISARSNQKDDIPHRLITRPILEVVQEEQRRTEEPPKLQIVRPGTFAGLAKVLEDYSAGHFDVVHFDLHGFVSEGG